VAAISCCTRQQTDILTSGFQVLEIAGVGTQSWLLPLNLTCEQHTHTHRPTVGKRAREIYRQSLDKGNFNNGFNIIRYLRNKFRAWKPDLN
jgi:hypothetical protein